MNKNEILKNYYELLKLKNIYPNTNNLKFHLSELFMDINLDKIDFLDIGGGNGMHSFYVGINGANKVICLEPELDGTTAGFIDEFNLIIK